MVRCFCASPNLELRLMLTKKDYILLISLAVVIVLVNVFLCYRPNIPKEEEFIPSEHPVAAAVIIDRAIQDYSKDHEGRIPQRLDELLGKYMPPEWITPGDLEGFSYSRISPYSYELRAEKPDNETIPDVTFTERGVK